MDTDSCSGRGFCGLCGLCNFCSFCGSCGFHDICGFYDSCDLCDLCGFRGFRSHYGLCSPYHDVRPHRLRLPLVDFVSRHLHPRQHRPWPRQ